MHDAVDFGSFAVGLRQRRSDSSLPAVSRPTTERFSVRPAVHCAHSTPLSPAPRSSPRAGGNVAPGASRRPGHRRRHRARRDDLTTALRVDGANQIRRDFADALNAVGQHDEVVVGIDARHPYDGPDPHAVDCARHAGTGNMWRSDRRRFGNGVEQRPRHRTWLDAVKPQRPHDAGVAKIDFRAPAVVQQVRRRRALRPGRDQNAGLAVASIDMICMARRSTWWSCRHIPSMRIRPRTTAWR